MAYVPDNDDQYQDQYYEYDEDEEAAGEHYYYSGQGGDGYGYDQDYYSDEDDYYGDDYDDPDDYSVSVAPAKSNKKAGQATPASAKQSSSLSSASTETRNAFKFKPQPPPSKERKFAEAEAFLAQRNATHPPVNVIVSGHVDSGKSTLTGHLLHLLGVVSTEEINRMKAESTGSKMGSFCYAWVSDSSATEREHGVTTDISVNRFVTDHRLVTIIDSPGHRDFIPNMIAGANQAQSALMILDASIGNFEAGFMRGGQTREHLQLMASLGVKSIILVVNKMDKVDWCRDRFNFIRKSILKYVQGVGFTSGVVVPCSGFQGDNLMTRVDPATVPGSDWYKGPTLIEAIDRLPPLQPDIRQPVRLVVRDTLEASSRGILRIQAQILGGFISTGDQLLFLPAIETGTVTAISIQDMSTTFAFCGDVGVTLTLEKMSQPALVTSGMLATTFPWVTTSASASKQDAVLSLAPRVTRAVRAQIRVLDSSPAIIAGQIAVFFGPGGLQRQAMISRVRNVLRADPSTIPPPDSQTHDGSDSEDDAPDGSRRMTPAHVLRPGDRAVVHIKFDSPLSTDIFTVCQASSRFLLRDHGITLAVGVVTSTWPMAQ